MRPSTVAVLLMAAVLSLAALRVDFQTAGAQVPTTPQGQRAVVLGGGGPTGQAWEIGIVKGLRDVGLDLTQADLVIGTSAGSVAGAQMRSGAALDAFYDALLAPPTLASPIDPARIDVPYFQETTRLWQGNNSTPALRIEVGARALAATRVFREDEFIQRTATRLGVPDWPSQPLQVTAVDVLDGTRRLIDKTQGVPIERAVAASTAQPGLSAPITLGDRQYMDGSVAGPALDAAAGYRLIVAVNPGGGSAIDRQAEELRAQGNQVLIIRPDAESAAARGPDNQDPTRVRVSAQAGYQQAALVAADLSSLWNGTSPSR